jgi:hypothetical protein
MSFPPGTSGDPVWAEPDEEGRGGRKRGRGSFLTGSVARLACRHAASSSRCCRAALGGYVYHVLKRCKAASRARDGFRSPGAAEPEHRGG